MSDLDSMHKASHAIQAWKFASLTLAVIAGVLLYGVIHQTNTRPVILLPYEAAVKLKDPVTIPTNGSFAGMDAAYLSNIAMSDINLMLNYVPENVVQQRKRFLSRLTPLAASTYRKTLETEASELVTEGKSQYFAPTKVQVLPGSGSVRVDGKLTRILGGQVVLDTPISYEISYEISEGYPHVSKLTKKED